MGEDILKVIENSKQSGIKLEDVIGKFKSINEEEIECEVSLLEKEGKIYKNCNGYYIVLDKDLKINKEKLDIKIKKEVENFIKILKKHKGTSIIVSNELGMGIVPSYPLGRYFREIAGEINQYVAEQSDEVYLTVSGIPMKIKG